MISVDYVYKSFVKQVGPRQTRRDQILQGRLEHQVFLVLEDLVSRICQMLLRWTRCCKIQLYHRWCRACSQILNMLIRFSFDLFRFAFRYCLLYQSVEGIQFDIFEVFYHDSIWRYLFGVGREWFISKIYNFIGNTLSYELIGVVIMILITRCYLNCRF